jgi:hypothetical protein
MVTGELASTGLKGAQGEYEVPPFEERLYSMLVIGAPPLLMLKLMVALPLELTTEVLIGALGAPIGVTVTAVEAVPPP